MNAESVNRWALTAQLVELSSLRFNPAGAPILDCLLEHQSEVVEAGILRTVNVHIKALAVGTVAEQISKQSLGTVAKFEGFLAASMRSRASTSRAKPVVFHIQSFQLETH